ncbi:DUF397 domain-containing protein [Streptomyces acidiscabies]|uniref:DUF397 domain-containing protein n=1 Tax=Streptomyces acidiscabies TaxID=42234 RepID=UPI000952EF6D|nr:DUF397 domain-containing protein [Streptomyces acidiscabies]
MNRHPITVKASSLAGVAWVKSSYSNGGGNCVAATPLPTAIALRDSKNPDGPALLMPPAAFRTFLTGVRDGRFSA